jgi:hypothetical protein
MHCALIWISNLKFVELSPQGRTNKRMALDGKLGTRTLILQLAVWVAEPRTIDFRREQHTG